MKYNAIKNAKLLNFQRTQILFTFPSILSPAVSRADNRFWEGYKRRLYREEKRVKAHKKWREEQFIKLKKRISKKRKIKL